ncbi:MAG TPA: class I SAM-dependent methyltransferase [Burkholderiaceae bacterium]|nr:class I SAM-dependent methyltransferase [Burkholderiaceae bacterium]
MSELSTRRGERVPPRRGPVRRALAARAATAIAAAAIAATAACGSLAQPPSQAAQAAPQRAPDVPYEPSPPEVVDAMLQLAQVSPGDRLYDLGSGDGRIVIAAARRHGARAVGVDIDPQRIAEANRNARAAGVDDRVRFVQADLFEFDFSDADVVTMFLWPHVNLKLRPKLQALRPGTRIVSHWHDLGEWQPDRMIDVRTATRVHRVFLWVVR